MSFQKKHIPNVLTIIRMVLAFGVFICFVLILCNVHHEYYYQDLDWGYVIRPDDHNQWFHGWIFISAGIIFVVASLTDMLDGYLARKYNWVSDFGKLWDPIADKVLVNITLICMSLMGVILWWFVVIMIVRDIIVDAAKMYAASKGKVVAADIWGKLKTIFQMVGIIFIFFVADEHDGQIYIDAYRFINLYSIYYWTVQHALIYIATIFSIISGVNYLKKISKATKAE